MPSRRALSLPLLAAALFLVGTVAQAQSFSGQWVGDLYSAYVIRGSDLAYVLIDEDDRIREEIPRIRPKDFPPERLLQDSRTPFWHGGAMYQVFSSDYFDRESEGGAYSWSFFKWEEGEWRVLGRYAAEPAMPGYTGMNAIPCDGGRFILVSYVPPEADSAGGWQPFCVASFPEGSESLRLDYAIDHGQDALRRHVSGQFRTHLELFGYTAVTDSHAVVVHPYTGLFWVFSLEKAKLTKAGGIFKKVTPEMIANGGFTGAVQCVNPERQGTVLVAAQDEDYFIRNGDYWKEYVEARIARLDDWEKSRDARDDESNDADAVARSLKEWEEAFNVISKEVTEEMRPRRKMLLENSPHIVWYRIHPENGRVERLLEPPEGGAALRGDDGWDNWESNEFRPMPDGSVKMGWVPGKIKEKAGDGPGVAGKKEAAGGAKATGSDQDGEGPADGDAPPEDNAADGEGDKGRGADEGGAPAA
jgi:hypothetical protein